MELRVLGCSGGIGGIRRTTSFLLGERVLIDAGSGVSDLSLEEMGRIRHIFLTHAHLDHITSIPLLVDSVFDDLERPLTIHALPQTITALKEHIFNWAIWPDFSVLPVLEDPVMRFVPMLPGEVREVEGCRLEMLPVEHIVPTVGYVVEAGRSVFAFSGDTTSNETFWAGLNRRSHLDLLIVEAAFSDAERDLCARAKHYCPATLAEDLVKLRHEPRVCLTHAKPGEEEQILRECRLHMPGRHLEPLNGGERFSL